MTFGGDLAPAVRAYLLLLDEARVARQ